MFGRLFGSRRVKMFLLAAVGLFVIVNVFVYAVYRGKTYPKTLVGGSKIGQLSFADIDNRVDKIAPPNTIKFYIKDNQTDKSAADLGVSTDSDKLIKTIKSDRSWLPLYDMLRTHDVPYYVKFDQAKLDEVFTELSRQYFREPQNAHITLTDGKFRLESEKTGWRLTKKLLQQSIASALEKGNSTIVVAVQSVKPQIYGKELNSDAKTLQKQQTLKTEYKHQGKTYAVSAAERTSWYRPAGTSYLLDSGYVRTGIIEAGKKLGIGIKNLDAATQATTQAMNDGKDLSFDLEAKPLPIKTYTYCVAGRGVDASYLSGLEAKLAAVYADSRGWGLDGQVALVQANSGCGFTVWLSAASQMPTFGAICDSTWSCRVGTSVVINLDRWLGATDAWNSAGGNLEDYRVMVINHETGHWFGFGHANCPGAGQPAPIMMQQSIDLQGCMFNPWPLPSELAALRSSLGL